MSIEGFIEPGAIAAEGEPQLVDNPIPWEVQCGRCGQWGHSSDACTEGAGEQS